MAPGDNDWAEYRLMVIDWHAQDIVEKREIKERLDAHEKMVSGQLAQIQTTLGEIQGSRKTKTNILSVGVPAAVTLIVFGLKYLLTFWIK